MGQRLVFESGGYGPSSILRHLPLLSTRRATFGSGSGSGSHSSTCQRWWQPSCLPALCSHAVLVVSRHAYQDSERARRWGLLLRALVHSALSRASAALAAATRQSLPQLCMRCMRVSRVLVHGVGHESDRRNQVHSDMKYIFCEYLRPFAAREKPAAARARAWPKSKVIYGEPSLYTGAQTRLVRKRLVYEG